MLGACYVTFGSHANFNIDENTANPGIKVLVYSAEEINSVSTLYYCCIAAYINLYV